MVIRHGGFLIVFDLVCQLGYFLFQVLVERFNFLHLLGELCHFDLVVVSHFTEEVDNEGLDII